MVTETVSDWGKWIKGQWDRWKITILFVGLFAVAVAVYVVKIEAQQQIVTKACESVTQVKNAALDLTAPVSTKGVTDAATLERIRQVNAARAQAQRKLERKLACRND